MTILIQSPSSFTALIYCPSFKLPTSIRSSRSILKLCTKKQIFDTFYIQIGFVMASIEPVRSWISTRMKEYFESTLA